jgi:chromosome segregation ATPase
VRLTRLALRNWRGFRGEVELNFDADITVIVGPNESGKSTLIEAAIRGLFDRHTAGGQAVEALQPWGSSLAPEVCVTFRTRDRYYRIRKRFLAQPSSQLSQLVNGQWQLIAEGDAADRRVLELIGGRMPGAGLSKSQHHGIIQALWVPQGSEELPSAWNREVTDTLEAVLGTATQTAETTALELRIREEHHQLLTEVRGDPRTGGELDRAISELRDTEERYREVREQRQRLEDKIQELARRQEEIREIEAGYLEATEGLKQSEEELKAAQEHMQLRLDLKNQVDRAERDYAALSRRVKAVKEAGEAIEAARKDKETLEACLKELEREIAAEKSAREQLVRALEGKRTERRGVGKEAGTLRDILRAREVKGQIEGLCRDLQSAEATLAEIGKIEETLAASVCPGEENVRRARELDRKVREGEAILQAQGLTVEFAAKQQVALRLALDDRHAETVTLDKDLPHRFHAGTRLEVELPDLISFTITSGSEQARQALEELESNRESLRQLLARFGVTSPDELEEKHRERQNYQNRIHNLRARLEGLRHGGNPEQLRQEISSLKGELAVLEERLESAPARPEWEGRASEYLREVLASLEQRLKELDEAIADLEEKASAQRIDDLSEELSGVRAEISGLAQVVQQKQEELTRLRAEDGFESDAARDKALSQAAAELEKKRRAYEVLEGEKEEKEDQPRKRHEALKRQVETLQEQLNRANVEAAKIQGALVDAGGLDLYQKEGNLEAELNCLRQRVERLNRDAQAWRLLDNLVADHKNAQLQVLVTPVKRQVDAWLSRVTGTAYAGVEFSEELIPVRVRALPWEVRVPLQELSYGTREQLNVLVRLAIGWVISEREPQVVVLDDRLVNTDAGRLREFRFILQEASQRVQLILLTCHPARYSGITRNLIDLASVASKAVPLRGSAG